VSNRVRSSIRALQDIFETSDRDIKKERATSCPAGGHWRGINHPREGLHFNAPGWISNSGEIASATTGARQSSMQPPGGFMQRAHPVGAMQRLSETRIPSLQMQRAPHPASPAPWVRDDAGPRTKKVVVVVEIFSLPFPSFFHSVLMYVTGFHGDQSPRRLRAIDFVLGRSIDSLL